MFGSGYENCLEFGPRYILFKKIIGLRPKLGNTYYHIISGKFQFDVCKLRVKIMILFVEYAGLGCELFATIGIRTILFVFDSQFQEILIVRTYIKKM